MEKFCFFLISVSMVCSAKAQSIIVRPDGTHSIGINHGTTTTVINPDGTHSIGINHGNTTTVVNPDGTHSVGVRHGSTKTVINPDGMHSIGIDHGTTTTVVSPYWPRRTGIHHGRATGIELFSRKDDLVSHARLDSLFSINSTGYREERLKLKVLGRLKIINREEYRTLKAQNLNDPLETNTNKANRIFDLHQQWKSKQLTDAEFFLKRQEIINDNL